MKMKAQNLSEEQRIKLLEMANELYKDEKMQFYSDVPKGLNKNHTFLMGFKGDNDYIPNCDVYMHWFEFCARYIAPKVIGTISDEQGHLVDYLYELWEASK